MHEICLYCKVPIYKAYYHRQIYYPQTKHTECILQQRLDPFIVPEQPKEFKLNNQLKPIQE